MKAISFLMFTLFFVAVSASAFAQPKTVSGKILDNEGQPLPGVTVVIKGTTQGTVTSIDGDFSLTNVSNESSLIFSFVGMLSQEIAVAGKSRIDVTMQPDAIGIEEVVAIGYGTQKKATLTGSIETVNSETFKDRAVSSPALALQGQTPGLVVTRSSSQPGNEGIGFQIRGATSVNGGDPLIVIDGSPVLNNESFYNMSTDDIESMSILKDGAASIYGSRAANGVILVTTKKGSGKMKVEVNSNVRLNSIGIRPPVTTMSGFGSIWLDATDQDAAYSTATYKGWLTRDNVLRLQAGEAGMYDTAWGNIYMEDSPIFDQMYGSSVSNQQNLSISGSSDKSSYRVSAGYSEDRGLLQTAYDGKKQMNLRMNYDFEVTDWLKFETGMSYFRADISNPATGIDATAISYDPPFFPAKNPDGQWYANFGTAGNRNAVASTTDGGRENDIEDQLKLNFAANFKVNNDLSFRATASVDKSFTDYQKYVLTIPTYTWEGVETAQSLNSTSSIQQKKTNVTYQTYGGFMNYNKTISDHSFGAMLGITAELYNNSTLTGTRQGFEDYGVYDLNLGSTEEKVTATGGANNWGLYSYLGRFNYAYKNKYLVEFSGRRDGSSKFADGYKWSNFFNGSLGWVISEESFMEDIDFISFLKLRASYGQTGNQVGIDNHDYLSTINFGTSIFGTTSAYQNTAKVSGITSDTRTWETVGISTIGMDFRVLNNKVFGSFDYFEKKNDGMLISINYASVLGGTAPKSNSGELETKGWEAVIGYKDKKGDFEYSISANIGNSENTLVSMEGVSTYSAGKNETVEGYALNSFFLYQTDGLFETEDDIEAYYTQVGNGGVIPAATNLAQRVRPGDTKKVDLDDSGSITSSGNIDDMNGDVKYMGDAAAHYNYGINFYLKYKGFDLSGLFQGVLEQNVIRTGHMAYPFVAPWTNQRTSFLGKTWSEDNLNAAYPRLTVDKTRASWNWANNDFMMMNNRYLRLKSLVVGYNFKFDKIEKLRVYFSGNDLFEFTSLKDGYDPEYGESTQAAYPLSRTYSLGVNLTF
jgi:TonB-linked SusC/RagA family outer membrane protein